MIFILTPEEMSLADKTASADYNISSALLMENAARSSAIYIKEILQEEGFIGTKITFFCGSGNNGGDGFALARHLFDYYDVEVFWIGDEAKMSPETRANFLAVNKIGVPIRKLNSTQEIEQLEIKANCIVDALIGTGGNENIRGFALDILKKLKTASAIKIAIDCPTGLNSTTGVANEYCFDADYTITMFAAKLGMMLNDGIEKCGKILLASLGAPMKILESVAKTFALEDTDVKDLLPKRKRVSSKFDYGRVLIISGSKQYPGAAALAANASVRSGAGLVHLATTYFHSALFPEVIQIKLPETDDGTISREAFECLKSEVEKSDSVAIGPGIGSNPETLELIRNIVEYIGDSKPLVIDADALRIVEPTMKLSKNVVLTPHTGEFSRFSNVDRKDIERDSYFIAKEWAERLGCVLHLKYVPSITTDGNFAYLNLAGNPGMASGGSGDVLTGIIASFLARGMTPLVATALASFVHSRAGDSYAEKFGYETLTPSVLIDFLRKVLR